LAMGQMNQFHAQYPLSNQVQHLNLSPNPYFGANDSPNPFHVNNTTMPLPQPQHHTLSQLDGTGSSQQTLSNLNMNNMEFNSGYDYDGRNGGNTLNANVNGQNMADGDINIHQNDGDDGNLDMYRYGAYSGIYGRYSNMKPSNVMSFGGDHHQEHRGGNGPRSKRRLKFGAKKKGKRGSKRESNLNANRNGFDNDRMGGGPRGQSQGRSARNGRNPKPKGQRGGGHGHGMGMGMAMQMGSGSGIHGGGGRDPPSQGVSRVSLYGDGEAKRKLIALIDDYLVSAVQDGGHRLMKDTIRDIMALDCKDLRAWSSMINETLRDRQHGEVQQFVILLVKLFKAKVLSNSDKMFQEKVVKYLALECDDSSSVCPQFVERVALFMATLGVERCIELDTSFRSFKKMHREYSEWNKKRQNKLYETLKKSAVQEMQTMNAPPKDIRKIRKM